jgi:hypothetical protein
MVEVLCRLAEQAAATQGRVLAEAAEVLASAELPRAGNVLVFDHRALGHASRNCIREVFRLVWQREGWPMAAMDHAAWDRLAGVVLGELPSLDLPGAIHARSTDRVVQIEAKKKEPQTAKV